MFHFILLVLRCSDQFPYWVYHRYSLILCNLFISQPKLYLELLVGGGGLQTMTREKRLAGEVRQIFFQIAPQIAPFLVKNVPFQRKIALLEKNTLVIKIETPFLSYFYFIMSHLWLTSHPRSTYAPKDNITLGTCKMNTVRASPYAPSLIKPGSHIS